MYAWPNFRGSVKEIAMRLKPRMTRSVVGEIWRPVVLGSGFSPHGYYCQLTSENGHGHQKQTTEGYGGNGNVYTG